MQRNRVSIGRSLALAAGLLLSGVGASIALAQGASPTMQGLLTLLERLQNSVDDVQESVDALGASNNFVFTPMVRARSGVIDCNVVNVSSATRQVVIQLINGATGTVFNTGGGTIEPGTRRSVGAFSPSGLNGSGYCKFTVVDGTKADIRANVTLSPNVAGDDTTSVSATAE